MNKVIDRGEMGGGRKEMGEGENNRISREVRRPAKK